MKLADAQIPEKPHSALGMKTPKEFEDEFEDKKQHGTTQVLSGPNCQVSSIAGRRTLHQFDSSRSIRKNRVIVKFLSFLILLVSSFCHADEQTQQWFGSWKVKRLICPFDCPTWKNSTTTSSMSLFEQVKNRKIEFTSKTGLSVDQLKFGNRVA